MKKRLERRDKATPDFITRLIVDDLADRIAPIKRTFTNAAILGPIAQMLPERGASAEGEFTFTRIATRAEWDGQMANPEHLDLPDKNYDLIVSVLDLQNTNDVPGFLTRLRWHLADDGLMLLAAIGGNSLTELRSAWLASDAEITGGAAPRVAPFIDVRDAGALLQRAGYALPVADIEHHTVRYADPLALMRELRDLGASNPLHDRSRKLTTRTQLVSAMTHYANTASDPDGRIRATLEILWLSGWAPHESQQKPLAPGSAEVSLTKVLKTSD